MENLFQNSYDTIFKQWYRMRTALEEKDIQVFLGDVLVPSVSIISPNKMIITTPKSEQGKKDLKIIAYDGSQIIITQTFEYTTGIEIKTEGNKTKPISGKTPVII